MTGTGVGESGLMKIVLVCNRPDATRVYRQTALEHGVSLDVADGFLDLLAAMSRTPYQGVMVDIPTKLKSSKLEKDSVESLFTLFPVIQVGWDAQSGRIRSHFFGQFRGHSDFSDFFREECRAFRPRRIRMNPRFNIHLNCTVAKEESAGEEERSVTLDASQNGCFVITSRSFDVGERLFVRFQELPRARASQAVVRRRVLWGESPRIPGIGISLETGFPAPIEEMIRALARPETRQEV